jgi:transcriptional regulator with XRE-family HTH domain
MTSKLSEKLKDPEYRKAFVASQINVGIPFQIRALLRSRPGWTQTTLAEKAEMRQPSISGLLTPGKTRPNIETLRRIAEAFDCGLLVRFAPFSELARWSESFDPDSFNVPSFADDIGLIERKPAIPDELIGGDRPYGELIDAKQEYRRRPYEELLESNWEERAATA